MTAKNKRTSSDPAATAKKKNSSRPPAPPASTPKSSPAAAAPGAAKLSALDAAALVLRQSGQPMSCPELIEQMAVKGYWSSPKGKTPASTLCAAMMREVQLKGAASRCVKTGPGRFAHRPNSKRS